MPWHSPLGRDVGVRAQSVETGGVWQGPCCPANPRTHEGRRQSVSQIELLDFTGCPLNGRFLCPLYRQVFEYIPAK
jgi:hypothetical protein